MKSRDGCGRGAVLPERESVSAQASHDPAAYGGLGLTPFFWLWDACHALAESDTEPGCSPPALWKDVAADARQGMQVVDVHIFVPSGTIGGSQERRLRA